MFKSEIGKRQVLALYEQKLAALAIDYREQDITTSFGQTRIIITGNREHPPLFIIHGSNGCAPISLEVYPKLAKHYQVFAIDVLAQPNKSEGNRISMKDDSYGQWINEIITKLDLEEVTLVGFSFGGLIILKTLINNEQKIKAAFLAAPAYIVNGNPLKALLRVFIPMKRFMKTKQQKYLEKFLRVLFTERDEFAVLFLSKVFQHFKMDFTPVPVISKAAAQSIQTPITLFAAKQDILFPGEKMIKRAQKIFPALKRTILLENSKHVQNRLDNEKIEQIILSDQHRPITRINVTTNKYS